MRISENDLLRRNPPKKYPKEKDAEIFRLSSWQKMKIGIGILIFLPKIIYYVIKVILTIVRTGGKAKMWESEPDNPIPETKAMLKYDEKSQTLSIKLNQRGLEAFIEAINSAYKNSSGYKLGTLTENVEVKSKDWHTHSDFWWPGSECELTIGTGESDKLALRAGDWISGNSNVWLMFASELESLRQEKATIVLDAEDSEWCTPDSTGRVVIHVGALD